MGTRQRLIVVAISICMIAVAVWMARSATAPAPTALPLPTAAVTPPQNQTKTLTLPSPSTPGDGSESVSKSANCRQCHQRFYDLWSTSHHGLAMQPFTAELARTQLTASLGAIKVGQTNYQPQLGPDGGWINEQGPGGEKKFPMAHVMGGKNVYYFLTPLDRGRLQVLPLAYDVRRKEWFDTAASARRHFQGLTDQPLDWRDPLYTFNTSCHSCHVSQLATNYDATADSYHTTWAEPGINCETCHGPSAEHVRVCQQTPPGQKPADLKIILTKSFSAEQHNSSCAICHAKGLPLTNNFKPGERFFDHYDLVTLENPDFHPDGRDLGENYTYTGWRMNRCAQSGQLTCVHCHTSSGRLRFQGQQANNLCLPCHQQRVKDVAAHSRHKADSAGNQCIACHMPMTEFARMRRSDHSLLPPTPAATTAFKSPNACNICHADKDAAWADQLVRQWHPKDYQAPVLKRAALIAAARQRDWSRLPDMLAYLAGPARDEVTAASLLRLLMTCADDRKWPAFQVALADRSPLVRAAAASSLAGHFSPDSIRAPGLATGDDYRLVRIRAAEALTPYPTQQLPDADRVRITAATAELEASLKARPDDWASRYNLGNYYADRNQLPLAVDSYQLAIKLRPDAVQPLVNAALVYARLGQNSPAEDLLTKALKLEPVNAVANLNLGMLKAELGDMAQAEQCFRTALKADPTMAQAAYNLAVAIAPNRLLEAIDGCRKAWQLRPDEPKYAYTLGFYLHQAGKPDQAITTLNDLLQRHPTYLDALGLLGTIYEKSAQFAKAKETYQRALRIPGLSLEDRDDLRQRLDAVLPLVPQ